MGKRVVEELAASEEEIIAALSALTPEERLRLQSFARERARMLRKTGLDKGDTDLVQVAIEQTLSRQRHWNKGSSPVFVNHLLGTIKSISNNWYRTKERHAPDLEADVNTVSDDGMLKNSLRSIPSSNPDPEEIFISKEQEELIKAELDRIEVLVAERPLASLIVSERRRGTPSREIQEAFDLTQTEYDTMTRWIYETVRRDTDKESVTWLMKQIT
jgi:hypothetical protein